VEFTQRFASTALGGWGLGATPRVGKIGLGGNEGKGSIRGGVKMEMGGDGGRWER
jgi:hypothetical protein